MGTQYQPRRAALRCFPNGVSRNSAGHNRQRILASLQAHRELAGARLGCSPAIPTGGDGNPVHPGRVHTRDHCERLCGPQTRSSDNGCSGPADPWLRRRRHGQVPCQAAEAGSHQPWHSNRPQQQRRRGGAPRRVRSERRGVGVPAACCLARWPDGSLLSCQRLAGHSGQLGQLLCRRSCDRAPPRHRSVRCSGVARGRRRWAAVPPARPDVGQRGHGQNGRRKLRGSRLGVEGPCRTSRSGGRQRCIQRLAAQVRAAAGCLPELLWVDRSRVVQRMATPLLLAPAAASKRRHQSCASPLSRTPPRPFASVPLWHSEHC
mmetsp:Transcript_12964/g.49608  ORF Transcript_12964/g.49608 Transcript_12964/m.49608 type:complete len:319 (+) Transcript_12964:983-1939(+)